MSSWGHLIVGSLSLSGLLATPGLASRATEPLTAQLQLTEQPATAIDWLLDTVETQPSTAEQFILSYPGLTPQQAAAIQAIYSEYESALKRAVDEYLLSINLLNNLVQPETTNAAIAQARADVLDHERHVYDLLFQRTIAIRAELTPAQRGPINTFLRSLFHLGTPIVASTFPADLVGRSANTVLDQLIDDGWQVIVRTPRTLLLDRGDQSLDLAINSENEIEAARLR